MESQGTRLEVEIFDENYTVVGDSSKEHIIKVAQLVNDRMKQLSSRNPRLSRVQVAVLAGLNLADELLKLHEEHDGLVKIIEAEDKSVNKNKRNNS
ncbi:MAG: cell division protein ZapA [Eubacteriales bacterium]